MSEPQYPQYPQNQANPQYAGYQGQGNPQYPPNPYGQAYPGSVPAPVAKPRTPGAVTGAFIIYLLEAVIFVLGAVVTVNSAIWDQAIQDGLANSSSTVDPAALVSTAKTLLIVVFALFAALFLFFAFMMRAGRNWARIVLTVLSGLSIASAFSARSSVTVNNRTYTATSGTAVGWVGVALSVLAIILMYLGASNAYFHDSKAFRHRPQY